MVPCVCLCALLVSADSSSPSVHLKPPQISESTAWLPGVFPPLFLLSDYAGFLCFLARGLMAEMHALAVANFGL